MARPREYDEEEVLAAARDLFWSRGYEATSVRALCEATGLNKGSLYLAFGDKHALFARVLDAYLDEALLQSTRILRDDSMPVADRIAHWLRASIPSSRPEPSCPSGCFATNTVVELAPHDEDVAARLDRHFSTMARILSDTIAEGRDDGSMAADVDPQQAARFLVAVLSGLTSAHRAPGDPGPPDAVVELALRALRTA